MPHPYRLTGQQLDAFDREGVVPLPGFLPPSDAAEMADAVWSDLAVRFGIDRARRDTWTVQHPMHFQKVIRSGEPAIRAVSGKLRRLGQ